MYQRETLLLQEQARKLRVEAKQSSSRENQFSTLRA
jgi:hypothetical protein